MKPAQSALGVLAQIYPYLLAMAAIIVASPRIAIASGTAFIIAQLMDVSIFDRLRHKALWWQAPLVSSALSSILDTALFFALAFAAVFSVLGANDAFAIEAAPLLGIMPLEVPRWASWALGDLGVKLLVSVAMLVPYRVLLGIFRTPAANVQT